MKSALLVALALLVTASSLSAEVCVKHHTHTDAYYFGGSTTPEVNRDFELWFGEGKLALVEENSKMIDMKALQVGMSGREPGLYCDQCGECKKQCVADLDIPTMMRSYMYVYGYRDLAKGKAAMEKVDMTNLPCGDCHACKVNCRMGFDVRRKLTDIARLRDVPEEFIV